ncbi:MAG: 3-oxoadipate enol-lactonase [Rhodocyclaceae bacterium]
MKTRVNGTDIHYETSGGGGSWVTLSHSLACDLSMWDDQLAALCAHHRVLRFDTRGHGASAAPPGPYTFEQMASDVLGLWDALGIERSHFVGLSMGGMIGQHLALRAPQRLLRLVLADTASRVPPEALPVWEERIRIVRARGMEPMVEPTLERWFTAPFREAHPEIMARIGDAIRRTPVEGYAGCIHCIARLDVTERLREIAIPALVLAGEQDLGTTPATARAIAAAIPGARLEILPSAAHLSNIEQAERFNRIVLAFLGEG